MLPSGDRSFHQDRREKFLPTSDTNFHVKYLNITPKRAQRGKLKMLKTFVNHVNDFVLKWTIFSTSPPSARIAENVYICRNFVLPCELIFRPWIWTKFSTSPPSARTAESFKDAGNKLSSELIFRTWKWKCFLNITPKRAQREIFWKCWKRFLPCERIFRIWKWRLFLNIAPMPDFLIFSQSWDPESLCR